MLIIGIPIFEPQTVQLGIKLFYRFSDTAKCKLLAACCELLAAYCKLLSANCKLFSAYYERRKPTLTLTPI